MSHELYSSVSGATAAMTQLEILADNIANAQTQGFKANRVAMESAGKGTFGDVYTQTTASYTDMKGGALKVTNDPFDVALDGEGFMVVDDAGSQQLTRTGRMALDSEGFLVTERGARLQGEGGGIQIQPGESFQIAGDGTVRGSESGVIDKLQLVTAEVDPIGVGQWEATSALAEAPEGAIVVKQGALEQSNVDPLKTMVELIQASRMFEAYQKAIQTSDELDARLNRLGGR